MVRDKDSRFVIQKLVVHYSSNMSKGILDLLALTRGKKTGRFNK